jgi:hypothetical protein
MKKSTAVIAGFVLTASTLVVGVPAANASPTITVTPKSGLKTGATVKISASGFKSGSQVAAVQCTIPNPGPTGHGCDIAHYALAKVGTNGKAALKLKVSKSSGKYVVVGTVDKKQHAKAVVISFK